jgi:hypothetical protein
MLLQWEGTAATVGTGNNTVQYYQFYPNDTYDCSGLLNLQQAYMRDQLFTFYQYVRVIGFEIRVKVLNLTGNPIEVLLGPNPDNSPDSDINLAKTRKYTRYQMFTSQQGKAVYLTNRMYVDQYFGLRKGTAMNDLDFRQDNSTGLGTLVRCNFQLLIRDTLGLVAVNANLSLISVRIRQFCRFELPIENTGS